MTSYMIIECDFYFNDTLPMQECRQEGQSALKKDVLFIYFNVSAINEKLGMLTKQPMERMSCIFLNIQFGNFKGLRVRSAVHENTVSPQRVMW